MKSCRDNNRNVTVTQCKYSFHTPDSAVSDDFTNRRHLNAWVAKVWVEDSQLTSD